VPAPMRVSLDKDDPGFCGHTLLQNRVFLDGEEQPHVITADDEKGEIVRFLIGVDGKPVRHPFTREPMRETLRGRVQIEGRSERQ
jgi:hypothetical protein